MHDGTLPWSAPALLWHHLPDQMVVLLVA